MNKFFLIACAALSLSACATFDTASAPPVNGVASCGLLANTLTDEKAMIGAETAYNAPAYAYVQLDAAGKLTPAMKATAKPLLLKAYEYLTLARTARNTGAVCSFYSDVELASSFANQAKAILPK